MGLGGLTVLEIVSSHYKNTDSMAFVGYDRIITEYIVCLSVHVITFEGIDLETLFWHGDTS